MSRNRQGVRESSGRQDVTDNRSRGGDSNAVRIRKGFEKFGLLFDPVHDLLVLLERVGVRGRLVANRTAETPGSSAPGAGPDRTARDGGVVRLPLVPGFRSGGTGRPTGGPV